MEDIISQPGYSVVCGQVFKRLEDPETRQAYVKEILETEFDAKMSEQDYVYYKMVKALSQMYQAGFAEGQDPSEENEEEGGGAFTIGTFLKKKISVRKRMTDDFIIKMAPIIKDIRERGAETPRQIAKKLTEQRIKTMSGNFGWSPAIVRDFEVKVAKRVTELKGLRKSIEAQIELLE